MAQRRAPGTTSPRRCPWIEQAARRDHEYEKGDTRRSRGQSPAVTPVKRKLLKRRVSGEAGDDTR